MEMGEIGECAVYNYREIAIIYQHGTNIIAEHGL